MKAYRKGFIHTIDSDGSLKSVKPVNFGSEDALKRWIAKNAKKSYSKREDFYILNDGRELSLMEAA